MLQESKAFSGFATNDIKITKVFYSEASGLEVSQQTVDELTARGVVFERYSGTMATDNTGIFRKGGPLIAWSNDPEGDILSALKSASI